MFERDGRTRLIGWRAVASALLCAAFIGGCGGGLDASVDTGGTGAAPTYSYGRIEGFGSIVVNGIHFDESAATIQDDEGAPRSRSELKLGMVVEVEAGPVTTDASGKSSSTATRVRWDTDLRGPVQGVDPAAGIVLVLGQRVVVDAQTVFDGLANGLASVQLGQQVEVHAFVDEAAGRHVATRIERKSNADAFKLRGRIANLDVTAKTFSLGAVTISYAGVPAGQLPALSNGLSVRVTVAPAPQGALWLATKLRADTTPHPADGTKADIEGIVADFSSLANFKINGIAIDASDSAVQFKDGTAAQIVNGVRLRVKGETRAGIVVARKVEFD